ncbi:ABC transporter ATP-binding protein [Virgisporangium aliadipatigenens]|uniref:ABC transporter ATP-binding protein n=1 Tax=Virgisporangium aliadipatigenens TaxID=741659 RepID=A0A8J3YY06_9ACTN|nr:ABC transporter ATP-binding protein [Virgisporangium aliadipatigenens]GIJ51771.1 ABC transporter ATP-binding protein [Virgisporangium aliadipatigenens]
MIELRGVGKRYPGRPAVLRGVDLTLRPRDIVAVTGGNGSGKSTLLRIVAGVSRPSTGTVTGRPAPVGWVPERFPAQQRVSARDYLTHHGRIRGLDTHRARRRAGELLDRLALVGGDATRLRDLSKGNAQKVALAQALVVPPELLVLDEPWSGLDASAHATLRELIADVAGAGGTVVLTDHREAVLEATATVVHHIDGGRLVARTSTVDTAVVDLAGSGPPPWRGMPGVFEAHRDGGVVRIRVDGARCDELLAVALHEGWSVRGVRR